MEGEEMRSRVERAEEAAFDYQRELSMIDSVGDEHIVARRMGFYDGYKKAEKGIISIIQARLNEIQGDAQPRPILRIELQEIINKIENGNN